MKTEEVPPPTVVSVDNGPAYIDGGISRLVTLSNGCLSIQTWGPNGWQRDKGAVNLWSFVEAGPASAERLAMFEVPPEDWPTTVPRPSP
jgi:hypothetical protein